MAQFKIPSGFSNGNKTFFEVMMIANSSGGIINSFGGSNSSSSSQTSNNLLSDQGVANTTCKVLVPARAGRLEFTIQVHGNTSPLYVGNSISTNTSNGFRIPAVDAASLTIRSSAALYGVANSGNVAFSWIETIP